LISIDSISTRVAEYTEFAPPPLHRWTKALWTKVQLNCIRYQAHSVASSSTGRCGNAVSMDANLSLVRTGAQKSRSVPTVGVYVRLDDEKGVRWTPGRDAAVAVQLPLISLVLAMVTGCAGSTGIRPNPPTLPIPPVFSPNRQVIPDIAVVIGRHTDAVRQVMNDLRQAVFGLIRESSLHFRNGIRRHSRRAFLMNDITPHPSVRNFLICSWLWKSKDSIFEQENFFGMGTRRNYEGTWNTSHGKGVGPSSAVQGVRCTSVPPPKCPLKRGSRIQLGQRFSVESMLAQEKEQFRCLSRCWR
jgi:hypothetical protein